MAALASCGARLCSTLGSQVHLSKAEAWSSSASACLPSVFVPAGPSAGQLRARVFSDHRKYGVIYRVCSSHTASVAVTEEVEDKKPVFEEPSTLIPTSFEVQSLLMEICDETSIAELQLKVGSFHLNVKRDVSKLKGASSPPSVVSPPPVPSKPMIDSLPRGSGAPSPKAAKTTSATSILASIERPVPSIFGFLESAADEGLLFVTSPKVGYFRKGRVAKGKSSPPLVEEGQIIKEGHVVCYLEQLGTQQPVESEIAGEIVKILWKDGEPVGYGDALIAVRPAFPGIKKLT